MAKASHPENLFWKFWSLSLIVKLFIAWCLPLANDEKYYWVWSHHPDWSYYDHPPMVAWLLYLGHALENFGGAVRWPAVLLGHFGIYFWFLTLKKYFKDASVLRVWFLAAVFNPLYGWGGVVVTPDLPLLFCWSLSIYLGRRYIESPSLKGALILGTSLGLGFLAKYQMVIFAPIFLAWILIEKKWKHIKFGHVTVAVFAGLVLCAPVLYWNANHDFDSFLFQMRHGLGSETYQIEWPLGFALSQFLMIFPVVFVLASRAPLMGAPTWLSWAAWFPLIFFGISAFRGRPEANWPIAAYPAILSLATLFEPVAKALKKTIAFWIIAFIFVFSEIMLLWLPIDQSQLKTNEFSEFLALKPVLEKYQPIYMSSFQMAAALSWETKKDYTKLRGIGRRDFFDYLLESVAEAPVFYLITREWDKVPEPYATTHTAIRIEEIGGRFYVVELRKK